MKLTGHLVPREDKPRSKCRIWELVVNMPKRGKRYPRRTRRFHGTYREAQSALRDFIKELEGGNTVDGSILFSEYAESWHKRRAESGMYSQRTIDREPYRLKSATMHLGDMRMRDITTADIEDCYSKLIAGDSPSGKKLQPWTISSIHNTLSKLFADAVRDNVVASKPTDGAKRPTIVQKERNVPTADLVDSMLDCMDFDDPRHMAIMLCARFGLRRSEAVMLDWSDWDGQRLHITKSAQDDGKPKPTKTVKIREVPAPESAKVELDARKSEGPICPMKPAVLSRWWRRNRGRWGMDGVRLHDLRHAYATRLAEAGVHPRVMMQLGGWDTIDVCMEIYTHVHSETLDDAVNAAFS